MNHRELILSAKKKARFAFLALPETLQDEIVDGLDGQTLTLEAASALLRARGHSLSHEAIAGYYRAVRMERRLADCRQGLGRVIEEFASGEREPGERGLMNIALAVAATGLADGSVGIKDVDLPKLVAAFARADALRAAVRFEDAPEGAGKPAGENSSERSSGLSADAAEAIRRQILGIK